MNAVVSVVSVSAVCDQVDQVDQVVPAHQVDDIDEAHQVDPVHQVDHKDELSNDIGATLEQPCSDLGATLVAGKVAKKLLG